MSIEETKQMLMNIADEETLKSNLAFTAFFIAIYENFVDYIVDQVKGLSCNGFETDSNGNVTITHSAWYKEDILDRKEDDSGNKLGSLKATLFWFRDNGAITDNDIKRFYEIKKQRNIFVHELTNCLLKGFSEDEVRMFFDLLNMYKKIDRWWINEIEIPCAADEIPCDYDPEGVQSVISGLFDVMVDVLLRGNSDEHKKLIEQYFNEKKGKQNNLYVIA